MRNMVHLMLLMIVVRMLSTCSLAPIPERMKDEPKKYALLIGGGVRECDNFESFYANIEYVYYTLKKIGLL
jgi:hypothetical protein